MSSHLKDTTEHNERLRACLALALTFSFYIQLFKISLFLAFFLRYKYILAYFQQNVYSKKLNNLFPNRKKNKKIIIILLNYRLSLQRDGKKTKLKQNLITNLVVA